MQPVNTQPPSILKAEWDGITVEYGCLNAIGEFDFAMPKHAISVAFAPHDRVTWSVDGSTTQTTALPAGSVFIYSDRNFVWHQRERESEYINLILDQKLLSQIAADNGLLPNVELEHRIIFPDPTILHIAQLFKSEVFNGGLAGQLYTDSLKNLLAVHLLRNYTGKPEKLSIEDSPLDAFKLNQVKDFIENRLAEDLSIADMANVVHMSQFHFARAFKTATGQPPHRYLTQRRMERAKVLLSVTRLPVAEVAYQVGFYNTSHFTSQFRKATGTTPKAYRDSF
ncbi:AraC family transcriptional regulator [Mastigocladopsis repens]|uniref:AraC family transcriptional regulator n=1 Tax=Mastigocladopsis repens TaxID=221287 RepID=UPI0003809247|nr:AraC family transcriptional regulator [Mastigocladopsis repens]